MTDDRTPRAVRTAWRRAICAAALLFAAVTLHAQLVIYDDALQNGWQDYSYPDPIAEVTNPVHTGTKSISYVPGCNFCNAVSLARTAQPVTTGQYPVLKFWVHGGAAGGQQLDIVLGLGEPEVAQASGSLNGYINGGTVVAGQWREVTVTLTTLTPSAPPWNGSFDRIDIISSTVAQPVLYLDDFVLQPPGAQPPAGAIQLEQDVSVASMVSDRITWKDANNLTRKASLAHDNVGVPNPDFGNTQVYGHALREFRYQLPNGATRVAGVTTYGNAGYGGFGYVTDHASRFNGCTGDDSPLGIWTPSASFQRVFVGRHHAILRFTQDYPRNCSTIVEADHRYRMPVVIDWVIITGRDNPLWAITYNVDQARKVTDNSIAPANRFYDDTRAPYGELAIDGEGFEDLDGVAWGDRWKFTSTGVTPVTSNSSWTWNQPNTIPWVKVWINGPLSGTNTRDATMGIVQTQKNVQQDAGGARDPGVGSDIRPLWNQTSGTFGAACGAQVMPCGDDWPYQAIGNSLGPAGTNNARMTWKTQYGFIGQNTYAVNGVAGDPATASGYPKKSYSTYIVLGTNTSAPVEAQLAQVEAMQTVALSTTVGSVVISGPAGITRPDNVTYQPPGYNHVYGALAFNASGNALNATINVGAGTLRKPLIILGNYTGSAPMVMYNGAALVPDADFFASVRTSPSEAWITLNRDVSGAGNNLQIMGNCAAVTVTTAGSVPVGATGIVASVPNHAGSSYAWTLNGGTITSGQGTATIQYTAGPAGTRMTLAVMETNGGACLSAGTKLVQVDFLDVPPAFLFHDVITKLALNGVTAGCGGGNFCPSAPVSRAQMAVFLLRSKFGDSYAPPPMTGAVFADVPPGAFAGDYIEELYARAVTSGCALDPLRYCPSDSILRSQMAVFLLRTKYGPAYAPPAAVGIFSDVPVGSFAANWIEELYNEGITAGCASNPLRYCPNGEMTRGQMAAFLSTTFNLQGGNAPATVNVDAAVNRHAIDPRIYGVAFADPATFTDLGITINRWGGNATSRYNWAFSTANRCKDFYFENQPDIPGGGANGASADNFIAPTRAAGVDVVMTIPMLSLLPKDNLVRCGYSVAQYGAQDDADGDCGNGKRNGLRLLGINNPADTSISYPASHQGNWIGHLKATHGTAAAGGVKYYALDNEPSLWSFDHWDVHPNGATYDEVWGKMAQYGALIKAADPTSLITGVEEWGWDGYFSSGLDLENGNNNDRNAHGGTYYSEWLLQQFNNYEQVNGTRILDIFALHFYPQSGEFYPPDNVSDAMQLNRNRSTRALWDPTFVDLSYIGQTGIDGGIVRLIPRLKQWRNSNYPGTQIAINEYNWGAENHINGATAQADILGIFGREALDMGIRWTAPPTGSLVYNAFKMYRNYDGQQSRFGNDSISASGPNPDNLSTFAAIRTTDGAMTVMIIAKTRYATFDVSVNLANFNPTGPAQRWQLRDTNVITNLPSVALNGSSLSLTVPAQSITLLVIPGNALAPPATLQARASSASTVDLRWPAVPGAVAYDLFRSSRDGAFAFIGSTESPSFTDRAVAPATAYLYRVQAKTASMLSAPSPVDAAVTFAPNGEPEDVLVAVNAMRAAAGLPAVAGDAIGAAGLRKALNEARAWIGLPSIPARRDLAADLR